MKPLLPFGPAVINEGLYGAAQATAESGVPFVQLWSRSALVSFAREHTPPGWFMLPDVYAWHTRPGDRGWPLHRDRALTVPTRDRLGDTTSTLWVALEGGDPGSGGVRVYPGTEAGGPGQLPEPRVTTGGPWVYRWNHRVLHEGGPVEPGSRRLAVAWEIVRADCAGPAAIDPRRRLGVAARVALVLRARLAYQHYAPITLAEKQEALQGLRAFPHAVAVRGVPSSLAPILQPR